MAFTVFGCAPTTTAWLRFARVWWVRRQADQWWLWAWGWVRWLRVVHSRRISLQDNGIRYSSRWWCPFLLAELFGVGGDGEECGGEHG